VGRPGPHEHIYHYPLTGFDGYGKPTWGAATTISVPESIRPLTRILYLADSDTMILAQGIAGSWDWTAMKSRIEVYHGWSAGNISKPNPAGLLTSVRPC
jgi:hypothetical protein